MSAVVIIGGFFTACGALVWSHLSDRRKQRRRITEGWAALAREGGGRFQPPRLLLSQASAEMVAGLVVVKVETARQYRGGHSSTFTRASASFAFGNGPRFSMKLTKGLPEVALGWKALSFENTDHLLHVSCPDLEATGHAWTARARELAHSLMIVRSTGEQVSVERVGVLGAGPTLEAMIELTSELASFAALDVAKYASLPDVELHMPTVDPPSPFRCVLPTKVGEIELRAQIGSGEPGLYLMLPHEQKLPLFDVKLGDAQPATLPPPLSSQDLSTLTASLKDVWLANLKDADSGEETLVLSWPRMPEEEMVVRGVELLIAVASHVQPVGAFR